MTLTAWVLAKPSMSLGEKCHQNESHRTHLSPLLTFAQATLPFVCVCVCVFNSKDTCVLPQSVRCTPYIWGSFWPAACSSPQTAPHRHSVPYSGHPSLASFLQTLHLPQNTCILMHRLCMLLLESATCSPTLLPLFPESRKLLKRCLSSNGKQCSSRCGQEKELFKTMDGQTSLFCLRNIVLNHSHHNGPSFRVYVCPIGIFVNWATAVPLRVLLWAAELAKTSCDYALIPLLLSFSIVSGMQTFSVMVLIKPLNTVSPL